MRFPTLQCCFFVLLLDAAFAAIHPAKRQFSSFQDVCGIDGVDCEDGWCCLGGQECVLPPSNSNAEPVCRDNILTDLGGDPVTIVAFPYSSLVSDLASANAVLSSLGITYTTFPASLPTTGRFTTLPTYTENSVASFVPPSRLPSAFPHASSSSTAAAAKATMGVGVLVGGGIMGIGVGMGW